MDRFFLTEQKLKKIIGGAGLVAISIGLALSLLFLPPYITFFLVIGVAWLALIFRWPFLGLIGYLLVVLLRPSEVYGIPYVAKAAAGSCLLVLLAHIVQQRKFPTVNSAYKAMLFFSAAVALSVMTAFWLQPVLYIWQNTLKLLVLYTLIIAFASTERRLGALGVVVLVAIGYAGSHVIYQLITGSAGSDQRIYDLAWGMFGDSNEFAQVVTMVIPILVLLLMESKGIIWRVFYTAMIGINMTIFILGKSRGGFLGMLVVVVALIYSSSRRFMLLAILILVLGIAFLSAPSAYFERLGSIADYAQDESATGRLDAWKAGIRMFLRNPVTGIGAGCFEFASPDYGLSAGMVAHNSFVTALAETGLIGFSAFILIMVYTFRACSRIDTNLKRLGRQKGLLYILARGLPISMIGYIVTGIFISTIFYPHLYILSAMASAGEIMTDRWVTEKSAAPAEANVSG
ncbi:MAG: O-antigen ligase family protein [Candidatus Zixiibacteriota bacterium]|nr:MAG: O-antigen ligase family protein [candidate division Zixibacteria bacterium]